MKVHANGASMATARENGLTYSGKSHLSSDLICKLNFIKTSVHCDCMNL